MSVTVNMLADDATLEDTRRVSDEVVDILLAVSEVSDVGAMSSQDTMMSLTGTGNASTKSSTMYLTLHEDKERSNVEIAEEIKENTVKEEKPAPAETEKPETEEKKKVEYKIPKYCTRDMH